MRMLLLRLTAASLVAFAGVSCGSSTTATGPSGTTGTGSGTFTATLSGTAFAAASAGITVTPSSAVPGSVAISGTQLSGTSTTSVSLLLGYLTGPGTYPLGVNQATTAGGTLLVETTTTGAVASFSTGFSGAAGTVTITTLSSTQIVGTFQATVPPQTSQTGASKVVTNGSFNLAMTGFVAATSANPGSVLQATLGGAAFNGATVVATGTGGTFAIVATTISPTGSSSSVSLTTSQAVSAGAVLPFAAGGGPNVTVSVSLPPNNFGGGQSDVGTVTITSLSGGFVKGSFTGTLGGPGGGLAVSGTFSVKVQ